MADRTELDAHRRRNLDTIDRIFAAISVGDASAQVANYTDDIVLETPFADPPGRREGRDVVEAYLAAAFGVFRFTLHLTEVHPGLDLDEMIVEFESRDGTYLPTGAPYENTYIGVFRFRDGLVCFQREFFNPLGAMRAAASGSTSD